MNCLRLQEVLYYIAVSLLVVMVASCSDKPKPENSGSTEKSASANPAGESIHVLMSNIAENFSSIYQRIGRQSTLSADDKKTLAHNIKQMRDLFKRADQVFEHKSDAYQIGYAFVTRYLKITADLLRENDDEDLRTHLNALREICSTCHTQDNHTRSLYQGANASQFKSLFQYAEFNYSTRNYQEAIKFYQLDLEKNKSPTELEIIMPLQRIMSVYLQVYNDPQSALQLLRKYESLKAHTDLTRQEMTGWIRGVSYLQAMKKSMPDKLDMSFLTKLVREFFGATRNINISKQASAEQEPQRIWLRGRLYEFLNNGATREQTTEILYWLSMVDSSTSYNYYFSYADLYLSQCVRKYADLPFAHTCFKAYENYIYDTYLKDARVRDPQARYPDDIETEYHELKALMKGHT